MGERWNIRRSPHYLLKLRRHTQTNQLCQSILSIALRVQLRHQQSGDDCAVTPRREQAADHSKSLPNPHIPRVSVPDNRRENRIRHPFHPHL